MHLSLITKIGVAIVTNTSSVTGKEHQGAILAIKMHNNNRCLTNKIEHLSFEIGCVMLAAKRLVHSVAVIMQLLKFVQNVKL